MMLNKGAFGGERILSRPSVELMTTDRLTPAQSAVAGTFLGDNRGWGFGMSIVTKRDDVSAAPGRFGWDGGLGTSWYADPTEVTTQQAMNSPSAPTLYRDFWTSTYQAIDD
jgi:CubicO group peptidase (beta-lactamase class C family)